MATLYVSEHEEPRFVGASSGVVYGVPLAEQAVGITGASVPSAAFATTTRLIRVHADAICSIAIGVAPVATLTKRRLAANQTEYFAVTPGHKIAVIANT